MGPLLGPFAAAFLAALIAGLALGLVRVSRLSQEWWQRWRARAGAELATESRVAGVPAPAATLPAPGDFPSVHGAIACAVIAAALLGLAALGRAPIPPAATGLAAPIAIASHPFDPVTFVPRALAQALFALVVLAAAFALALGSASLERALRRLVPLSLADLRAGAMELWTGAERPNEPFGVGLSLIALFAAPVAALALVARSAWGPQGPEGTLLFAALFFAVPAAYAAAAERSQRDEIAHLRRRAALRQLLAAPVWTLALLAVSRDGEGTSFLAHPTGWLALLCGVLIALPGTANATGLLHLPQGGDEAEPSAAVRAITGLSHHAWLVAWAAFAALWFVRPFGLIVIALVTVGMLALLLAARTLAWRTIGARAGTWLFAAAWPLALIDLVFAGRR